jgi:pyruvate,water dikinase
VVPLERAAGFGPAVVGAKAQALAVLAASGFPVPAGFVITRRARDAWEVAGPEVRAAMVRLGARRFAVRSSAAAEDLADASFAGQYDTVLDVAAEGLPVAVRRVFDSAAGERVSSYRAASRGPSAGTDAGMAVLVQEMIAADAAGVAFTANPMTGRRDETIVTAVRGGGERLVSGEAEGDEWAIRSTDAVRNRSMEGAIDGRQAVAIATLARRVERRMGCPQDIEWAIAEGAVHLLQARPMTALPDAPAWEAPGPGQWRRNFRVGEWLSDPMTPLFATWLLELMEEGLHSAMRETAGAVLPFRRASVNGWYYTALPHPPARRILVALLQSRGRIVPFALNALIRVNSRPDIADRRLLGDLTRRWRHEHLPRYRTRVADAESLVGDADEEGLERLVDHLGREAGAQMWWLELLGGAAWKMEACLAGFGGRHLRDTLDQGVQVLTSGLGDPIGEVPDHAVQSLDWFHPTRGELASVASGAASGRHRGVEDRRRQAEAACRAALAGVPALRRDFDVLLKVAQRYAVLREEQARELTLAWPVLRACVLRLGARLRDRGSIVAAEDVFFLTRSELQAGGDRRHEVDERRAVWRRQRRLAAPLTIGAPPRLLPDVIAGAVARHTQHTQRPAHAIVGQPASPGRATGAVRVVHDPAGIAVFRAGEVLVARATAPAWTPLFSRAAAVVTDGGTLAAHASLVAREYGIPAVVATGDATLRLRDGQVVTVDGTAGTIET